MNSYDDYYLYVTRLLDPRVVPQLQATRASVTEYAALESRRLGVQVAFALMYTVIALIVLLSAVWIGFNFRQPACRADPPPDRRRQRRFRPAISTCACRCARRRAISPISAKPSIA